MEKNQITIDVNSETLERYEKYYPNVHKGIEIALNAWINIRRDTIYEMKGFFTKDEVKFLIDFIKDINYVEEYCELSMDLLIMEEEYSCRDMYGLAEKHNINYNDFLDKVRHLGMGKSIAILDWAKSYWTNGTYSEVSIDDYIKILTEKSEGEKIREKILAVSNETKDLSVDEKNKRMNEAITKDELNILAKELLGAIDDVSYE